MRSARKQAGQATTEFVVLSFALVPLLLIVPLMGKYIDLMHAAETASRYVAFEGTVHHSSTGWKSDASLAEEVRKRFFGHSRTPVLANDVSADEDADRNLLWRDHAGRPLIDDYESQVSISTGQQGFNFHGPTRPIWRNSLGLPDNNLSVATVTVRPRNVVGLAPFDSIDLVIGRRTALLTDSWAAGSVDQVQDRIEHPVIYPMSALAGLVEPIGVLLEVLTDEPLVPGLPDWDRVPCDRLEGGC